MIGLTATPRRTDGRGLGEIFDAIIEGPGTADLTETAKRYTYSQTTIRLASGTQKSWRAR
ncbi:MAG: hypothetical protein ACRD4O_16080 [Bryobacteraceae bacterium]